MDFNGGLCSLCWIVVAVVDVSHMYVSGAIIKLACTGDAAPIVM